MKPLLSAVTFLGPQPASKNAAPVAPVIIRKSRREIFVAISISFTPLLNFPFS
jgi:hypothetical protein